MELSRSIRPPKLPLKASGELILKSSEEANELKQKYLKDKKEGKQWEKPKTVQDVQREAAKEASRKGMNSKDETSLLGLHTLQHGQYRGKPFRWIISNDPGYVLYLSRDIESKGKAESKPPSLAALLVKYASTFKPLVSMHEAIKKQKVAREAVERGADPGAQLVGCGLYASLTYKELTSSLEKDH